MLRKIGSQWRTHELRLFGAGFIHPSVFFARCGSAIYTRHCHRLSGVPVRTVAAQVFCSENEVHIDLDCVCSLCSLCRRSRIIRGAGQQSDAPPYA